MQPTQRADAAADEFFARARARLSLREWLVPFDVDVEPATLRGDHMLNPDTVPSLERLKALREAAVLIPVMRHAGGPTVLLTQRTDELPSHAGQVAFPGGKLESDDETPLHAALREAQEEIGLPPDHVEPLGYLAPYHTTSGYRVVPVVAAVEPGFPLRPDHREVADVFEVPLAFLMDPANHQRQSRVFGGTERHFLVMPFEDRFIWGVTAGIIHELYNEVYGR